ncbi:helix-turn-helix domain-containing protein [Streptomyces hiroshimensis]|uniref:MerR family transcriptional regulator n=1 Tax=Streptomyces hiroshimensis TaxID=66424 RepID=A0ABQ2Y3T4_9ACTN|nr:MerR family transcriptional regulator [Streptomyces hiroshimensis]GGX62635.1 MerR family transcriptional regulator [Streptomyces hiroshimensis]
MSPDATWSIGELAERAGVTVKAVRFYSDRGLLPEAGRSGGGHRRYGPEALDRLRLIRSLRTLDVPVPDVGRVLERDDALEDVVAGRLREIGSQLTALRWRDAALRLLQDCTPAERAERLGLIGAVSTPPSTAALASFWRRWLPPRLPARLVSAIVEEAVPQPPDDPTPAQVLAFARLHAFTSGPCTGEDRDRGQPEVHRPGKDYRPAVLYDGLREAFALAAPDLRALRPPHPGEALDCFVSAHARARGVRDTAAFRRRLGVQLAAEPRIDHYWELVAELTSPPSGPPEPTPGAAHDWLCAALDASAPSAARS